MGCGESKHQRKLVAASKLLQINRSRAALDSLSDDDSPEGHYLKAAALLRLRLGDASQDQIREALKKKPQVAKYQGFDLLLELSKKNLDAAEELITLYDNNRASGAISFFATSAFLAKQEPKRALIAFDGSLALAADAPEFMWDLLTHAVNMGRTDAAETLIERLIKVAPEDTEMLRELLKLAVRGRVGKSAEEIWTRLEKLSPGDPELAKQRVLVLDLANKKIEAIRAAANLYEERQGDEESALVYAFALSQGEPTPNSEKLFQQLTKKYPRNLEILAKYAIYLTKAKRLSDALELFHAALDKQKEKLIRQQLHSTAIGLCLSVENAELAQKEVDLARTDFDDPLLSAYFEGRVLYLQKDYDPALRKFREVVDKQKDAVGTQRALAADALIWLRKILADHRVAGQLDGVVEKVQPGGVQALQKKPSSAETKSPKSDPSPAN